MLEIYPLILYNMGKKEVSFMRIGENILNLRKNYKLSQEKFAELLGVSRQAV